ncbi:hypothetical protein BT69DRAFT_1331172 [Atractiella rhizophila]|nr:hypothetical protein BT69DRAFT_1331172 [Atractiella rhizophila]
MKEGLEVAEGGEVEGERWEAALSVPGIRGDHAASCRNPQPPHHAPRSTPKNPTLPSSPSTPPSANTSPPPPPPPSSPLSHDSSRHLSLVSHPSPSHPPYTSHSHTHLRTLT